MSNPMKKAVNSLFRRLGVEAKYLNKTIYILLTEPDEVVGVGFVQTHSPTHLAKIKICDAPDLKVGDKLETAYETFIVRSEPVKDIHKLVWSCELICE